jgi:dihydrofolate reductase
MKASRKLILYIAASLDGFIATKEDDLSFLEKVSKEGEDYGYQHFVDSVDTVILGNKTYQKVISMGYEYPHQDKESYVVTRNPKPDQGKLHFYSGNLKDLVLELKGREGKNIFCDGGAFVVNNLLKEKLIDEIILSIVPLLLGDGIRLFGENGLFQDLELLHFKSFPTGLVQVHYEVKK